MRRTLFILVSLLITLPAYSEPKNLFDLMDTEDLLAIQQSVIEDPLTSLDTAILLTLYNDFLNSPRYKELEGQFQVEAMKILMKPRYMMDAQARVEAAAKIQDPCLNEVGDIKPELICQAAARAAYLRQTLNLIRTHLQK